MSADLKWDARQDIPGKMALKIDGQQSGVMTLQRARLAQDKNVQSVFSEVLQNAGLQGYASAEVAETSLGAAQASETLAERVQDSWNSWYRTELLGRYASKEAPTDLGESYGDVLAKAYDAGAYVEPKSFLKSLSADELKAVQSAHWLAAGIQVDSLTEEGALNLLLPPAAQVDLNHDGLTQSGAGYGIRFPDSTTPAEVAAAWEVATDGMPLEQRMTYELNMKLPLLSANFITDAAGRVVSSRAPGDPDFVNPMIAEGYSYVKVTQGWMAHLEYFKNQIDPDRYAKDMDFWTTFQQNLRDNGVA